MHSSFGLTAFIPLSNLPRPIHPHLSHFLTSRSFSTMVRLQQISILSLRINISTSYTLHVTPYIPRLALRLRCICSSDETFALRTNELIQYLNNRGYSLSFLKHEIQRVHTITRVEALQPSVTTSDPPPLNPRVSTGVKNYKHCI